MTSATKPAAPDKAAPSPSDDRPRTTRKRILDWLTRVQFILYTILILFFLALGYLWQRMFIVIPAGSEGVMFRSVGGGTVTTRTWGEGLHVIPPWDKMYIYDLRLQRKTLNFKVLSDEGLTLGIQVVVQYRPNEEMLGYLQEDIGADYFESIIQPEIESHIRRTFGSRPAHEIYASMRDVLQEVSQLSFIGKLEKSGATIASRPYVYVQGFELTQIELPKIVEDAIVEKYHQEQLMLAYRYKLEREEKEADRKRTEAAGIRDFNAIAGKVSPDMLRWRSIDAATELAKSNNSKVIVFGGGQGGMMMPLYLGDSPGAAPPADDDTPRPVPPPPGNRAPAPRPPANPPPAQPPAIAPPGQPAAIAPAAPTQASPDPAAQQSQSTLQKGAETAAQAAAAAAATEAASLLKPRPADDQARDNAKAVRTDRRANFDPSPRPRD